MARRAAGKPKPGHYNPTPALGTGMDVEHASANAIWDKPRGREN